MDRTELDSPRRELSNGSLESVVTLLVRWQINYSCASPGKAIQLYLQLLLLNPPEFAAGSGIGDMSPSMYFERPHYLGFHGFTLSRQMPLAAKLILVLFYKFVPRSKASATRKKTWRPLRD